MISWKLMKERITTPVAEHRMLNVGVPYFDLRSSATIHKEIQFFGRLEASHFASKD